MTTTVTSMRSVVRVIAVLVLPMLVLRFGYVPRPVGVAGLLRHCRVITVMGPAMLDGRRVVALVAVVVALMIRWCVHTPQVIPLGGI
ncbi:hypothetical protein R2362_15260 [Mycobacteroides chelonae]|nr:hypothetical protein [Mycobacteroides chelonae]